MAVITLDIVPLFHRIEVAIDEHPLLQRHFVKVGVGKSPFYMGEPSFRVARSGWTVLIPVSLKGSRKKPTEVSGVGETPEAAADKLIANLDFWARAIA